MHFKAVIAGASLLTSTASGSVIGIDFGSEWMKVALVQLKVPLEIVTNTISKRKTEVAIAFDRGERMFGSDAVGALTRKPLDAFTHFREMLGRTLDHSAVEGVAKHHYATKPYLNDTRQALSYTYPSGKTITSFTAEELAAMVLTYARDITKDFGGLAVRDCVLTVPSFATMHERRALITSAEIAGLKVLSLIEDNTAAALHYGKDNVFENTTVLYYNMGSSATQVSVVRYSNYTTKEMGKNKTVGTFEVLGKAWDSTLGGEQFDLRVLAKLEDSFKDKTGIVLDKAKDYKPLGKLRAQAQKTKHVLSANTEIPIKVNSVKNDKDLVLDVTRAEYEAMCADLLDRVTAPIDQALAMAGLSLSDINAIEMLGGAQRVPAVQAKLQAHVGADVPLGVHLNADEASALGAAFHAANISTAFKVRKTGMTDYSPFAVGVGLKTLASTQESGGVLGSLFGSGKKTEAEEAAETEALAWTKSATVFKGWSRMDSKKVIAFHHDHDVTVDLSYVTSAEAGGDTAPLLPPGTPQHLATFNVTGVAAYAKSMESKGFKTCGSEGNPKPKVVLHFKLDSSAIVRLSRAEVTCEQPKPKKESANATAAAAASEDAAASEKEGEESEKKEGEEAKKASESSEEAEKKEGEDAAAADAEKKDGDDAAAAGDKSEDEKEAAKEAKKKAKKEAKEKAAKEAAEAKAAKAAEEKKLAGSKAELAIKEDYSVPETKNMDPAFMEESKAKLAHLNELDQARMEKLSAKNGLEAFLYAVKNKMEDEAEAIAKVSTEEQREAVTTLVAASVDWLDDEGYDVATEVYKTKLGEVEGLVEPLYFRLDESTKRPEAVAMAEKRLKDIKLLVAKWETTLPQVTEEERADVIALVEKAETWLAEKLAAQEKVAGSEPPAFTAAEVSASLKPTANLVTKLSRKPAPKPAIVLNSTNATDAGNATAAPGNATADAGNSTTTTAAPASKDAKSAEGDAEKKDTAAGDDEL